MEFVAICGDDEGCAGDNFEEDRDSAHRGENDGESLLRGLRVTLGAPTVPRE